jgi:uncharacterized LabA/DUF88 family protein
LAKRVMIFIDGSNLYHNLQSNFSKTSLDYREFSLRLTGSDRELVRTYYYNSPLDQTKNPQAYTAQQKFFSNLYKTPDLEVRLGRLQTKADGTKTEKGVDVKIAVDMIAKAYKNHYDVAVLISGDADFVEVVKEVKDYAKHVELVTFPKQPCYHLRKHCDRIIELDIAFMNGCWI